MFAEGSQDPGPTARESLRHALCVPCDCSICVLKMSRSPLKEGTVQGDLLPREGAGEAPEGGGHMVHRALGTGGAHL